MHHFSAFWGAYFAPFRLSNVPKAVIIGPKGRRCGVITVLTGSPRGAGLTNAMTRIFLDGREAAVFDLYEVSPLPCTACCACEADARCAKRDLDGVFDAIGRSDRLVIASPVYNYSFPAPMKAFFDRLQVFYNHPVPPDPARTCALLLSAGCSGKYAFDIMTRQTRVAAGELGFTPTEAFFKPHTDRESGLSPTEEAALRDISDRFFRRGT